MVRIKSYEQLMDSLESKYIKIMKGNQYQLPVKADDVSDLVLQGALNSGDVHVRKDGVYLSGKYISENLKWSHYLLTDNYKSIAMKLKEYKDIGVKIELGYSDAFERHFLIDGEINEGLQIKTWNESMLFENMIEYDLWDGFLVEADC